METVKKHISYCIVFLMLCLTGMVLFGHSTIAEAAGAEGSYVTSGKIIFQKKWEDDDTSKRPEEIKFKAKFIENTESAFGDAQPIEEITLTEDNNWTYTVKNPNIYGYFYDSVQEIEVDGYEYAGETIQIDQPDKWSKIVTVTLTNKKKQEVKATSAQLGINGIKTLEGRDFREGDKFRFEIRNSANAPKGQPLPDPAVCEINPASGNSANIEFGTFTFTQPGTYIYVISEYQPQQGGTEIIPGITYDTTGYRLTVVISKNEQTSELEVSNVRIEKSPRQEVGTWDEVYNGSTSPDTQYCNFTNTYSQLEQTVSLTGTKFLENKKLSDYGNDQFRFIVEAIGKKTADGNYEKDPAQPMPAGSVDRVYTAKNLVTGGIVLPATTFTKDHVGTEYRYTIREAQPTVDGTFTGAPLSDAYKVDSATGEPTEAEVTADGTVKWVYKGVVYDNHVHTVDAKAELVNESGQEEIKVAISHDAHGADGAMKHFIFTNVYHSDVSIELTGTKKLIGRSFAEGDAFTFSITPRSGAPVPVDDEGNKLTQVTIRPTGGTEAELDFGTVLFEVEDLGRDVNEKIFQYEVSEIQGDTDGMTYDTRQRIIQIKVTKGGSGRMNAELVSDQSDLTWNNHYNTGSLTVSKTVSGNAGDKQKDFHFTVILSDKSVNGAFGDLSFTDGTAAFELKHGESKTADVLPSGITYTVTETEANQDGYTTESTGASGTITEAGAAAAFTNTKNSTPPKPEKPDQTDPEKPTKPAKPTEPSRPETPVSAIDRTPQTGDETNLSLWLAIMGMSVVGLIAVSAALKRRNKDIENK